MIEIIALAVIVLVVLALNQVYFNDNIFKIIKDMQDDIERMKKR